MYSYRVYFAHSQVLKVELWEETSIRSFCKIAVSRDGQRFIVQSNYIGRGLGSISAHNNLERALEGFYDFFVEKVRQAFETEELSLGDVFKIFPNALVECPKSNSRR